LQFARYCQVTLTRRQRSDHSSQSLRVKLPPVATNLTAQRYRGNSVKSIAGQSLFFTLTLLNAEYQAGKL